MGARTNFQFKTTKGDRVVRYSHWGGDSKLQDLANALEASRGRWDDNSYAIRITISQIVGDNWNSETGYGVFVNETCEESYQETIVDFEMQFVELDGHKIQFNDYIKAFAKVGA